ncbi:MAG: hypothetical protein H3C47_13745 [Candidatus Cloacimonetes bacterium]|nr:hypothetical protein [Candidatus Cloacimonadota bacterium]
MAIPKAVHTEINRHYAILRPRTNRRNRDWVGELSFEEQYEYGKKIMDDEMDKFLGR